MEPTSHASRAQNEWLEAKLRIWCVGGWWFQIPGQPRRRLDGNDAASELFRHLALSVGGTVLKSQLQIWLSRTPGKKIGVASLNTAVSRLRGMLRGAAGERENLEEFVLELLPRAGIAESADRVSSEASYKLGKRNEGVWVDIQHAASAVLGTHLIGPSYAMEPSDGRGAMGDFQGESRLRREMETQLASAPASLSEADLDAHLRDLTPPISSLTALVPLALDRLGQGRMLSILAGPDSGRMHLAEAIELAARIYCGRSTEEIREQPKGGMTADDRDLRAEQPGHICVLDLTRPEVRPEQIARLKAVAEPDSDTPPALLLVREGPLPSTLSFLTKHWIEEEPIQLPAPEPHDVLEAYLIGTEGRGSIDDRKKVFADLRQEYEGARGAPIGLRAVSSAASIAAEHGVPPSGSTLPGPPAQDFDFRELDSDTRHLTRCLAWFGNRPFDLEDARCASGREDLGDSDIFAIATKIPGGRRVFELRPQMIDVARVPAGAHLRMCKYLIGRSDVEPLIERWPGRAMRILDRDSVPIEDRLDLAMVLFETCRSQGLARKLAQEMAKLRSRVGVQLDERLAKFEIERARLLTHLGDLQAADSVLEAVVKARSRGGHWTALRARARLRRAIVASLLGESDRAKREAREAQRYPSLQVKVENFYGWEATSTSQFEEALSHFRRAMELGGGDEEQADAVIGMSRNLIRLGRPREAEEALAKLQGVPLRRHTRDRVARVSASLCHLRGEPSRGIDQYIDPALLSASSNYSASALLLEASAFLHLEAEEVNAAVEDIERSRSVLRGSGGKINSASRYVRALIYAAQAEGAQVQSAADLIVSARKEADRSVGAEIARNPWARARAHTLRGRLALCARDWRSLADCLSLALEAHRELDVVCPRILLQTLELAQAVGKTWGVEREEERLRGLVESVKPQQSSVKLSLEEALAAIAAVLHRAEEGAPPPPAPRRGPGVELLGRVGQAVVEAAKRAQLAGLRLRVLVPRSRDGLDEGLYDVMADGEALQLCPTPRAHAVDLIALGSERQLVRRFAVTVLIALAFPEREDRAYVILGEWLAGFKGDARERGIAVFEPVVLRAGEIDSHLAPAPTATVALPLGELPILT